MATDALIEFSGFWAAYRTEPVLKDIDWQWLHGQQWAVLGANGAGKSALADAICDKLKAQRGNCQWQTGLDPKHDIMQLSFELHKKLIEHDKRFDNSNEREDANDIGTRVGDFILQGAEPCERFQALISRCHIEHILDHGIRFISTGESRKAMLAQALLAQPRCLIIDNPYEGLDLASQQELHELLNEILASDLPVLLLLQDSEQIPAGISHILELDHGCIHTSGEREATLPKLLKETEAFEPRELPPAPERSYELDPDEALFELRHVDVSYNEEAILTDINWQLQPGQHCHIMGPNGAGKSTLLSMICGDNHKAYGQDISLFGKKRGSGESIWEIKQKFGLVNTQLQLNHVKRMKVKEVVASGLFDTVGLYDNCAGKQKVIVEQWLHYAGLDDIASHRFEQLSFGQQRLALLARAMVKSPLILILDEPCLGLDHAHRSHILRLVDQIAESGRSHILYVSHVAEEVPSCINQRLTLSPHSKGGYTAELTNL